MKIGIPFICFIVTVFLLMSCQDSTLNNPSPGAQGGNDSDPVVNLIQSDTTIFSDTTLEAGAKFDIVIRAASGGADLDIWKLYRTRESFAQGGLLTDVPSFTNQAVPDPRGFELSISEIDIPTLSDTYIYRLSIFDLDGREGKVEWKITSKVFFYIQDYGSRSLEASGESYFIARFGNSSSGVGSDGSNIEFFYYYDDLNGPTLYSPTDPNADSTHQDVGFWTTKVNTQIGKVNVGYDNIIGSELKNLSISGTKVESITVGDLIGFEAPQDAFRPDGVQGLLRITSITSGSNGKIEFDIKITQ